MSHSVAAGEQTEFRAMSPRAQSLLHQPEGLDIDWKRDNKFDAEDLVAFANSQSGGVLLLGVEQVDGPNGEQRPRICGCRVGDHAVLEVMNRAKDCLPPIHVRVYTENLSDKPFLRVEVPSGDHKPYCTKSGVYKIRSQGRNAALSPPQLLAVLLEVEGRKFIDNFRNATTEMSHSLTEMYADLHGQLMEVQFNLGQAARDFVANIEGLEQNLGGTVDEVTHMLDGVAGQQSYDAERQADQLDRRFRYLETAVAALLTAHRLDDQVTLYWRPRVHRWVDSFRSKSPRMPRKSVFNQIREELGRLFPGECEDELLHKLCVERLGDFPLPERKQDRSQTRKRGR